MAVPGNGQGKRAHHEPGLLHSLWVGPVVNIHDCKIIKEKELLDPIQTDVRCVDQTD
jgi:hypothetical protein